MIDLAKRTSGLFVMPLGSKRVCENLSHSTRSGTPYWSVIEIAVANESMRPETTEPVFAIVTKISPGWPSSNMPTVMYPSWPPIENLCVIDCRSSGRRRRKGRAAGTDSASLPGAARTAEGKDRAADGEGDEAAGADGCRAGGVEGT